ncbi:16S rRNA methyltransferase, partial [Lacticaseibacillus paracasei]
LLPHGQLYAVIQKKQGASSALKLMKTIYPDASIVKKEHGYLFLKRQNKCFYTRRGTLRSGQKGAI